MAPTYDQWPAIQKLECSVCQAERERRNRVIAADDARVHNEPYLSSLFIHTNNDPKYHAMLLRAHEHAKRARKHVLWFQARDEAENPSQIARDPSKGREKLRSFLQKNDQRTAGVPGLNILYEGMQAKVTEKLVKNKNIVILKTTPCTVIGWILHPADAQSNGMSEKWLNYMPLCIYLKFPGATWTVDPRLGPGVWPLFPVYRTWELNKTQICKI